MNVDLATEMTPMNSAIDLPYNIAENNFLPVFRTGPHADISISSSRTNENKIVEFMLKNVVLLALGKLLAMFI